MQERLGFNANNRLNSCSRTSHQFSTDGIVQHRGRRYGKEQVYPSKYSILKKFNFLH